MTMPRHVILLPLLLLTLFGCAPERSTSSPPLRSEELDGSAAAAPLSEILDSAFDRAEDGSLAVLDRLGDPRRIEAEPVQNRHDPAQTDTLRTYVYDGLELDVYAVAGGKELLEEVRVTGSRYETAEGLGVGSTRAAVRDALGPPLRADGDTLTYERTESPEDPTPTTLEVRLDGDRVAAMTWQFYVD